MIQKLEQRNRRAVVIGLAVVVAILAFHFLIAPFYEDWREMRRRSEDARYALERSQARIKTIQEKVPAFEMPVNEYKQRLLFAKKIAEQCQAVGVSLTGAPKYVGRGHPNANLGLKSLKLGVSGKGQLNQILDLLVTLPENPYFVAIEEFKMDVNPSNRQEVTLAMTVSTYAE